DFTLCAAGTRLGLNSALAGLGTTIRRLADRTRRRAIAGLIIRLGGYLVRITAVITLIEAGALEVYARSVTEQPMQLHLLAFRQLLLRLGRDRLERLEGVFAVIAVVIISGHVWLRP